MLKIRIETMKMAQKPLGFMLISTAIIFLLFLVMQPLEVLHYRESLAVLFPKGLIGIEQRNLLLIIQALMLIVIIPVYILTFIFSWRYSAHHTDATYDPDLVDNKLAEFVWWGVPLVMTLIIGTLTWVKTYELDPYKPIASDKKPLTIQVVALQWKWLFIYPEEQVASLNFLQFPENTPLHFVITSDAPMNSFWIPDLGGQIYAMPQMKTELNLIANTTGDFRGSSANLSGEGFAGMHFIARSSSEEAYQKWIASAQAGYTLDAPTYTELAKPSQDNPVTLYHLGESSLFDQIIMKYMHPVKL